MGPNEPPTEADQPQTRRTASGLTPIQPDGSPMRDRQPDVKKRAAWRMIAVSDRDAGVARRPRDRRFG
jgi:hypothetical protein